MSSHAKASIKFLHGTITVDADLIRAIAPDILEADFPTANWLLKAQWERTNNPACKGICMPPIAIQPEPPRP